MSTILDALRRAEAERATPPGASLPSLGAPALSTMPAKRKRLPWLVALAALALLLVGALVRYAMAPPPATAPALAQPAAAALPAPPQPAASASPPPAPTALLQVPGARVLPAAEPSPVPPREPASMAASAPAQPPRVPRVAELAATLRQQLPPLQLGGSLHSPDARMRSLILNGQFYREGDQVGPELVLEEIGPRAARLRFRGQAFELPY